MDHATLEQGAEAVVARQLETYNARDLDAHMALWHDEARLFEHPSKLIADGKAEIRARVAARFGEPDLFAELLARVSVGNLVIDREIVTRNLPEGRAQVDVIAMYEVEGDRIARAWFKMGAPRLGA